MSSRITFGSNEKRALEIASAEDRTTSTASTSLIGSVQMSFEKSTELSESQLQMLEELERKNKAKSIAVPTDDKHVRQVLRDLHEPMTLFGEGPYERRERLRKIFATREDIPLRILRNLGQEKAEISDDEDEEFFTPGGETLLDSRMFLAKYSLDRASYRVATQRKEQEQVSNAAARAQRKSTYAGLRKTGLFGSQFGSDRPMSAVSISPDSALLATGCFGGSLKLWDVPGCNLRKTYNGHKERVGGISWHPSYQQDSESTLSFASGASDGSVCLWNVNQEQPIATLEGHALRVASCDFHPSGRFLGTAGFDLCWKMWDVETGEELLIQEGHSKEVFALKFQWDGSLAASGGLDSLGRIWDLRTGRSIMLLQGHIESIHSIDWSPNGFEVATASADHTIRIHDLRQLKSSVHVLPAHTNLVSSVRYRYRYKNASATEMDTSDDASGYAPPDALQTYHPEYLVSAGFDNKVKIWGSGDFRCLSSLSGHENKIMSMDISRDGNYIVSASYDRTFKIWSNDDETAP